MNAEIVLPLEKMTIAEKMDVIDRIMDDLSRNSAAVPPIPWHGELLAERAQKLRCGDDRYIDLEEAELRIRQRTKKK